jgi:hypothetical protein
MDFKSACEQARTRDGSGCGAQRQTWSAALDLRAKRAFDATVNPMG